MHRRDRHRGADDVRRATLRRPILRALGPTGTSVLLRLSAFILLCIGVQITWNGASALLARSPRVTAYSLHAAERSAIIVRLPGSAIIRAFLPV